MAFCNNCGNQLPDGATFCSNCGAPVGQSADGAARNYMPRPVFNPYDHTADFDQEDISANKVTAMAAYILGMIGIVIALLAAPDSKYAAYHSRQALKFEILNVLLGVVMVLLCWTVIIPIAGGICMLVLFVIRIICFFQVCSGKAKDAAIIRSLSFLK